MYRVNKTLRVGITLQIDPERVEWPDAVTALKDALQLEAKVTKKIREVIVVCEEPKDPTNYNDYHVSSLERSRGEVVYWELFSLWTTLLENSWKSSTKDSGNWLARSPLWTS